MSGIPILCYHNIEQSPATSRFKLLYTSPEKFERQLWALRRLGLKVVSVGEGVRHLGSSSSGMVMLSIDDGYLDTLTQALPLLRKYRFTATCYLVSDAIGTHNSWDADFLQERKPLLNHAQVEQWLAAGMEIGSHSCSHPRLHKVDAPAAEREIFESRAALRKAFGVAVDHFCYPFGSFSDATVELVKRAGYISAVTVLPGIARASDDPYRLPRILVNGEQGWLKFLLKVATPYTDLRNHRRVMTIRK